MQPTTKATVNAVVKTPELLENILIRLDTKTLLLSQRVNKQLQGTIGGSSLLQQALFFKLASKDGARFGTAGINDLFMDVRRKGAIDILPNPTFASTSDTMLRLQVRCTSELPRIESCSRHHERRKESTGKEYEIVLDMADVRDWSVQGTESWRRMYVLQGATEIQLVGWRCMVWQGGFGAPLAWEQTRFLTAGEMYEEAWTAADDAGCAKMTAIRRQ